MRKVVEFFVTVNFDERILKIPIEELELIEECSWDVFVLEKYVPERQDEFGHDYDSIEWDIYVCHDHFME